MAAKYREVVHTPRFSRELGHILPDAKRADEFIDGATWGLCREPLCGKPMAEASAIRFLPMVELPDHPSLALYYAYNDDYVWFISIRATR